MTPDIRYARSGDVSVAYQVGMLRRAWVNVDALWAAAIVVTGVFTLFT